MKGYWKTPGREVYSASFGDMLRSVFWCHVVMRLFPSASDPGGARG